MTKWNRYNFISKETWTLNWYSNIQLTLLINDTTLPQGIWNRITAITWPYFVQVSEARDLFIRRDRVDARIREELVP